MSVNFAAPLSSDEIIVTDDFNQIESVFAPGMYYSDFNFTEIFENLTPVNPSDLQNIISDLNSIKVDKIEE